LLSEIILQLMLQLLAIVLPLGIDTVINYWT